MKKIEAVIREEKLNEIRIALEAIDIYGMTIFDVKGRGTQRGISLQWRVGEYRIEFLPKKMMMLVVNDDEVAKVVDVICEVSASGKAGDGKIFISSVDEVIKIRTRETGAKAV